ncbi:putative small lipoprotein YifL [Lachnospiraceae bacterium PF1-21]|uniref:DUF6591 domain-containing protein n=1 Tax=Ohessyouella blattaphilus TaxID=2949333 RepID=UPI003E22C777
MKKLITLLLLTLGIFSLIGCGKKESYDKLEWPESNEIVKLLPKPKSDTGKNRSASDDFFFVTIADTSRDDFEAYSEACKEKGFDKDVINGDDYFYADYEGEYKYSLSISFETDGKKTMNVSVNKLEDKGSETETETEAKPEEAPATDTTTASTDGVTPEYKEFLDQYEIFMNNYVEFMKKYQSSSDITSMMGDFNTYMSQYTEMMNKLSAIDSTSLTGADLIYYNEVTGRVNQKLLEVAQ